MEVKLSETCYNVLIAKTSTEEGKEQLKTFVEKSKTSKSVFTLNGTYPMPQELNIEASSALEYGLEIIRWQKGEPHSLELVLDFPWCKELGISTIEDLSEHLVSSGHADLSLGQIQYDNLVKYGAKNWYDWRIINWGCKWDTFESEILIDSDYLFEVKFSTANGVPSNWLEKVAKEYPKIIFTIIYDFVMAESAIVQHSGKLFDLEHYRGKEVKTHSNKLMDYNPGSLLRPVINSENNNLNDKLESYPFVFIVVDKDAAIVRFFDTITDGMCKEVISKSDYKNMLIDNIFKSCKAREYIFSFNMDYDEDTPVPSYSTLVVGSTIDELVSKSNSIRDGLHKPIIEIIHQRTSESTNQVKDEKVM